MNNKAVGLLITFERVHWGRESTEDPKKDSPTNSKKKRRALEKEGMPVREEDSNPHLQSLQNPAETGYSARDTKGEENFCSDQRTAFKKSLSGRGFFTSLGRLVRDKNRRSSNL